METLRKLWIEGLSASQIAAELANGITRNAVIGKVHRLGLSGRAKAPAANPPRPRIKAPAAPSRHHATHAHGHANTPNRAASPVVRGATALAFAPMVMEARDLRPQEEVVIPISERVTIMELKEAMCRWPLGDPTTSEFRFCGAKSPVGVSYCNYHSSIAYQPAHDRRRERDRERRLLRAG